MKLGDLVRAHYSRAEAAQEVIGIVVRLFRACDIYMNNKDTRVAQVQFVIEKILWKNEESKVQVGYSKLVPALWCHEVGEASLEELYTHSNEKVRKIVDTVRRERERNTSSAC